MEKVVLALVDGEGRKEKRDVIIEAAEKVFAEKGFYQAKVEEIADKAGVGKGTVYEYFDSKEQLFKEMLACISSEYIKIFDGEISSETSSVKVLRIVIEQHLHFLFEHKQTARLIFEDYLPFTEDIRDWLIEKKIEKLTYFEDMLQKGIQRGEFREDIDVKVAAHLLFGTVISIMGSLLEDEVFFQKKHELLAQEIVDLALNGIRKQGD